MRTRRPFVLLTGVAVSAIPAHLGVWSVLGILLWTTACGGDASGPEAESPRPAQVVIEPAQLSFEALGRTATLTASVLDQFGAPLPSASVAWRSTAPGVASVDESGVVTAVGAGQAELRATAGSASATIPVTVTQVPAAIVFTSEAPVLDRWGDEATLSVRVEDAGGSAMAGAAIAWSSSNDEVAAVEDGRVTTWATGEAIITASVGELSERLTVTVAVQRNAQCTVPGDPAARGAPAAPVAWTVTLVPQYMEENISAQTIPIDVDQDGRQDVILVAQNAGDRSSWSNAMVLLNQGGGVFTDGTATAFGAGDGGFVGPRVRKVIDVNGDGLLDVWVGNAGFDPGGHDGIDCDDVVCDGAANALLIAQAGGGFRDEAARALVPSTENSFTHSGDLADVDCDGDPDLFEGNWNSDVASTTSSLKINSAGVFMEDMGRIGAGIDLSRSISGSHFCDLDRDGDPELLLGPAGGRMRVLVNDGFGHFRALPETTLPSSRSPEDENVLSDFGCGDLDGDGWTDIVALDHSFNAHIGKWQVVRNLGGMEFEDWTDVLPRPDFAYGIPQPIGAAYIRDLNGDGWPDLMTGDDDHPQLVLWNTGGAFTERNVPGHAGPTMQGNTLGVGDFNGDGILDIFMQGNPGSGTSAVIWGN